MTTDDVGNYDETFVLGLYLKHNYLHLFSGDEWDAFKALVMQAKIRHCPTPQEPPLHYVEILAEHETPSAKRLLADGEPTFWRRLGERMLREHGDSIVVNRCQRCRCIVVSPAARQCLWCHYDWHPRPAAANEVTPRPSSWNGSLASAPSSQAAEHERRRADWPQLPAQPSQSDDTEDRSPLQQLHPPAGTSHEMSFFADPRCALCNEPLGDRPHLVTGGRSGTFRPRHRLERFRNVSVHWECYEDWPERLRFAAECVSAEAASMSEDEHLGLVLYSEDVCVGVSRHGFVNVWLMATGTCLSVPFDEWTAWLSDPRNGDDNYHRVEVLGLCEVLPELRRLFPTTDALLAAVDWDAKRRYLEAREEERRRWQAWREAVRAHNEACRQFFREHGRHGLTCPHCSYHSTDIEYLDRTKHSSPSCFVCPACARSFGYEL
jgi:hypothetical protein